MAVPKKKVSRGRRNMRRFSTAYKLDTVTFNLNENGTPVRPHSVTVDTVAAYVEAKKARKAARGSAAKSK